MWEEYEICHFICRAGKVLQEELNHVFSSPNQSNNLISSWLENASRVWTYSKRIVWNAFMKSIDHPVFLDTFGTMWKNKIYWGFHQYWFWYSLFVKSISCWKLQVRKLLASPKMQGETDLWRNLEGSISWGHLTKLTTRLDLWKWTLADHLKPDWAEQNSNTIRAT